MLGPKTNCRLYKYYLLKKLQFSLANIEPISNLN